MSKTKFESSGATSFSNKNKMKNIRNLCLKLNLKILKKGNIGGDRKGNEVERKKKFITRWKAFKKW